MELEAELYRCNWKFVDGSVCGRAVTHEIVGEHPLCSEHLPVALAKETDDEDITLSLIGYD